jgi:hypothetical protein
VFFKSKTPSEIMSKISKRNLSGRKTVPVSVRLTSEEKQALTELAGGKPLSDFIRQRLFGESTAPSNTEYHRLSIQDQHKLLVQILTKLGQSENLPALNDLSEAAKLGLLPLTPQEKQIILQACEDIAEIRQSLFQALGLRKRT